MKTIFVMLAMLASTNAYSQEKSCKINLWSEKSTEVEIYKLILKDKGYEPVFDYSADLSLNISDAGFADTGCDDGGFFGDKNFKRTHASAEIRYKNHKVIDSIYGADIQTESTTFNNPQNKRISCANNISARINAATKIPDCETLKDLLQGLQ